MMQMCEMLSLENSMHSQMHNAQNKLLCHAVLCGLDSDLLPRETAVHSGTLCNISVRKSCAKP